LDLRKYTNKRGKKLHNEELHNLCSTLGDYIRRVGHVACHGKMTNTYKMLVGKPQGQRPLGKSGHRQEDTKMDLREGWTELTQDRIP
jgi:hypothetical protein